MGKTYRSLQQWNLWLQRPEGQSVLHLENRILRQFPASLMRGRYGVLIGVPQQQGLLKDYSLMHQAIFSPIRGQVEQGNLIESDLGELPIGSGSADLVLLPHTLEYMSRPHHLLAEACRIVRPAGHIIVTGFHPLSRWGFRKFLLRDKTIPFRATFLSPHRIRHWLDLSDFVLDEAAPHRLFSSIYALVAEARVTPGTPIRLRWKQTLPAFRATLAGPSIR